MEQITRSTAEDAMGAIGIGGTLTLIAFLVRRALPKEYFFSNYILTTGGVSIAALTFGGLHSCSIRKQDQLARRVKTIVVG